MRCPDCKGLGLIERPQDEPQICSTCDGDGQVDEEIDPEPRCICPACDGLGEVTTHDREGWASTLPCGLCDGRGTILRAVAERARRWLQLPPSADVPCPICMGSRTLDRGHTP